MSISTDKKQIIKKAEELAKRGNVQAMNMLHLYDLKRAGHKAENLNIPSEGGTRFVARQSSEKSLASSSASW